MTMLVGTCSWTGRVNHLAQTLYGTSRPTSEVALRLYSSLFPIVEVDSTFYALPSLQNCQLWAQRTPGDFAFHIKAFSLFTTHKTRTQSLPADIRRTLDPGLQRKPQLDPWEVPPEARDELWRRYREALAPLQRAGKLGFILLQFPPWFGPLGKNAEYILSCRDRLPGFNVAVEFRNRGWFEGSLEQRTPAWLKSNNLTMVCVDTPEGLATSIPRMTVATGAEAYVRLHGRNAASWGQPGTPVNNIHDYWYSEKELLEWLGRVRRLEEQTDRVHALFNTVQGLDTARIFQRMVSHNGAEPEALGSHRADQLL
jgi:uncharacterized protein YecE (DUF72 family)